MGKMKNWRVKERTLVLNKKGQRRVFFVVVAVVRLFFVLRK